MANRLIIIAQYPIKMRYQEWWISEFKTNFSNFFDEVIVLPSTKESGNADISQFSNMKSAILFEKRAIFDFLELKLYDNDILLLNDISFPGLFSSVLYHKRPHKCFSICHATSINNLDIFEDVRYSKWLSETAKSMLFDKIFVATNYHAKKLGWKNVAVVGMPRHSLLKQRYKDKKENFLVSTNRKSPQKRDTLTEKILESVTNNILIDCNEGTWEDYYNFLYNSKIVLFTSSEETFGYGVVDAVYNGAIPLAPNKFSYSELLDRKFLYDDIHELIGKIHIYKDSDIKPYLLNDELVNNFYENVAKIMLE
jgi:hypothetical protein